MWDPLVGISFWINLSPIQALAYAHHARNKKTGQFPANTVPTQPFQLEMEILWLSLYLGFKAQGNPGALTLKTIMVNYK